MPTDTISYLALGDSYTIGEAVAENERWPAQLVSQLKAQGFVLQKPDIIATTGWTTDELLKAIEEKNPKGPFGLVSLLIGVNNQYRGYAFQQYQQEFSALLAKAIHFAGNDPTRVFVVSIPDYGKTPFGQEKDPEEIARELALYNREAEKQAVQAGAQFINITPVSEKAASDPELTASDRLHPSGQMYSDWTSVILPDVVKMLN